MTEGTVLELVSAHINTLDLVTLSAVFIDSLLGAVKFSHFAGRHFHVINFDTQ